MSTQRRPKVLVVDDSATTLTMEELLLRRNYEVIKATSGAEALRVASEQHPEVILLDVMMPNMDGLETCRLLRGIAATKATPIIMVTTRGEDHVLRDSYINGATDFVTKPIDAKVLLGKIQHHLGRRQ
jgi:CheY-like chemotaxis protein